MPRRFTKPLRAVLAIFFGLALALALGEALLRLGIRLDLPGLRNPASYAHPFCDDDYHKLRFRWQRAKDLRPGEYVRDPLLGWVPDVPGGVRNPIAGDRRPRIALFGDSFAAGVPPSRPDERIAVLLEERLPRGRVADFAVAGYGVDQIYLRFEQALAGDPAPDVALVGLLLEDLDRVIDRFRAGPKPYFELVDGKLALRGTPIRQGPEEWLEDHPVKRRSFFRALLARRLDEWREGTGVYESSCRREDKERLNRRILEELVARGRRAGVKVVFVLLYGERDLRAESWREGFLRATLAELGADVVDTKPWLLARAEEEGARLSEFYFPLPNGHLNGRGNAAVADALYRELARSYGWDEAGARRWKATVEFGREAGNPEADPQATGFEDDGDVFAWTSSPRASLRLPAPPEPTDLVLYVETMCAVKRPDDDRTLEVRLDGRLIGERPLAEWPECWTPTTLELAVGRELYGGGEHLTVALELPYLLTPREAGFAIDDKRRLGVALKSVTLRAVE